MRRQADPDGPASLWLGALFTLAAFLLDAILLS